MKRLIFILLLLPCLAWGSDLGQEYARMSPIMLGGGMPVATCGPTSEPAGDIFSDGFEGSGSGGYEFTSTATACVSVIETLPSWCAGATIETANISAIGDATTQNCTYGYRSNPSGTQVYTTLKSGTLYNPEYVEFSFYVDSVGLAAWSSTSIAGHFGGPNGSGTKYWDLELYCNSGSTCSNATNVVIRLDSTGDSEGVALTLDTWYYVRIYMADNSASCTITIGTTYGGTDVQNAAAWTSPDYTAGATNSFYSIGNTGANTTYDIYYGYFAADDDGTF